MNWLIIFFAGLAEKLVSWFFAKGIKTSAYFLGYVTFVLGLFSACLLVIFGLLNGVAVTMPASIIPSLQFAMAVLPPQTPVFISVYVTALITKRVFDWHHQISAQFTQSVMTF